VAGEVRAELARQRRSYTWLADQIGTSFYYVSRRLRGDIGMTLDDVAVFAQALNVEPEAFLGTTAPRAVAQ